MVWREFWSLTSMCYPTPYSFLLFYIDMPLIPPSLRQAREIKTGRSMSLIPSLRADDSVHWRFLLVISKKQHNDLSVCTRPVPHTQHGTQKSLTKRLKELLFLHFFFFSPVFLVKAPKLLDAYDAVQHHQAPHAEFCHPERAPSPRKCIPALRGQIASAGSYFSNYKRRGPLCSIAVPWFHMLATLIPESKHL